MATVTTRILETKADQEAAAGFMIGLVGSHQSEVEQLRASLQEMCDMVAPTLKAEHRLSQGLSSALIRARQLLRAADKR